MRSSFSLLHCALVHKLIMRFPIDRPKKQNQIKSYSSIDYNFKTYSCEWLSHLLQKSFS